MNCDEVRTHLTEYTNGVLPAEIISQVDRHLSACPSCRMDATVARLLLSSTTAQPREPADVLAHSTEEAPVIKIAHSILLEAIRNGAGEIRLEPDAKGMRVVFHASGEDREAMKLPRSVQNPVVARFKVMAELDIQQRHEPQFGHIEVRCDGEDYRISVSTTPGLFGESVLMVF